MRYRCQKIFVIVGNYLKNAAIFGKNMKKIYYICILNYEWTTITPLT